MRILVSICDFGGRPTHSKFDCKKYGFKMEKVSASVYYRPSIQRT